MLNVANLANYFSDVLRPLSCHTNTQSYITSIFSKNYNSSEDYSNNSITLIFAQAKSQHNFITYQQLADWLFFIHSLAPQHLMDASSEYYQTIAQLSYYNCYKLINKQWKLFEELADQFPTLVNQSRELISGNNILPSSYLIQALK